MSEIRTLNRHGSMFPLAEGSQRFIAYAIETQGKVLDIGAAYGISTLPALAGGSRVIANDISEEQLQCLWENASVEERQRLTLLLGRFPDQVHLPDDSLDAVLASHVLHFLNPSDFIFATQSLYAMLKPKGKVFIQCMTPYHRFMEKIIPSYEKKKAQGEAWPAFVEHSNDYALQPDLLPPCVNLMDPDILQREFSRAGFDIETCRFIPCPKEVDPHLFPLDGREWVVLIATK